MDMFLGVLAALIIRDLIRAWAAHQVRNWADHSYMYRGNQWSKSGRNTRRAIVVRALAGSRLLS